MGSRDWEQKLFRILSMEGKEIEDQSLQGDGEVKGKVFAQGDGMFASGQARRKQRRRVWKGG